jgi:hypothetical protein
MEPQESDLVVVSDDRSTYGGHENDGYYEPEETTGDLVTEATGELRRMVLVRAGLDPESESKVTITEENWNSGYCETCSNPETDFRIAIDGGVVFDTQGDYRARYEANPYTTFGVLQWWLTNKDEEDSE